MDHLPEPARRLSAVQSAESQISLSLVKGQSQFILRPVSGQSQFSLSSVSVQSQFSLSSVSGQSQASLSSVTGQSQFSLRPEQPRITMRRTRPHDSEVVILVVLNFIELIF